jgi:type I restriction enzyme S subunit
MNKTKFKQTEIGIIPEDWEADVLGNHTNLIKGISYRSEDYCSEDEGFIFINLKCVARNGGFREEGIKYYKGELSEEQSVSPGDILIANTDLTQNREIIGSPLKVPNLKNDRKMCISLDLTKLDVISKKLNGDFLYYYLMSPRARHFMIANGNGTTVVHLSTKNVPNMVIPLPNIEEQKSIAKILSSLDDKIELNQTMNKTLEAIAQVIFKYWFIDFEFPDENGEPYKSSGGKMINSELGTIPKICKVIIFEKIIEISSGKRPKEMKNKKNKEFNIPLIGASSIMGYTSDILYTKPILIIGRVGTHGVVQRINENSWPSDNTLVIQSEYYEYGYQVLKNIDYKSLNRGSTQPLITQTDIKKYKIIFPKQKMLLKDFEKKIGSVFKLINKNKEENKILSRIRDVLLPKLMSGKIRVPFSSKLINQNN